MEVLIKVLFGVITLAGTLAVGIGTLLFGMACIVYTVEVIKKSKKQKK